MADFSKKRVARFPCGGCKSRCSNDCVKCSLCKNWYHRKCQEISDDELKTWGNTELDYVCVSCRTLDGEEFYYLMAMHRLQNLKQATTMAAVPVVSKTLMYGSVKVQAMIGAFENETPDCLLVFWDQGHLCNISNKSQPSKKAGGKVKQKLIYHSKLLEFAGKKVMDMWTTHRVTGDFKKGEILVTPGGKLKCSEIIHVPCDGTTIVAAARAGLRMANCKNIKTVGIPILCNDILRTDVNNSCIGILTVIKKMAVHLEVVKSVTFIIEGTCDFSLFNNIFEKESRIHGTGLQTEVNKRDHHSVNREKSVGRPRSVPKEPVVQHISPVEHRCVPMVPVQSMTETNKRDHRSVRRENSEYPPSSAPTHQEVKQKFPDGPGHDLNPPVHSMTETNKRDHRSVRREKSEYPPRSAQTYQEVKQKFPDGPGHDLNPPVHSMTETNKRDHRSVRRENSEYPPRSVPTDQEVKQKFPDGPGHDLNPPVHSMTETNKRDHRSVRRENSEYPPISAPTHQEVKQKFPDGHRHDLNPLVHSMTETNKRDHRSVRRENSEYPPISAPTHQEVKQKFPDGPGHDLNPPVHSMTETNKRDHRSVRRENSEYPPISAPTHQEVKQKFPDGHRHDLNPLVHSMTETNKRDHRSVRRENSEYPPISAPTHQEVKQKFPDGPGHDLNPPVHSMTETNKRDHRSVRRENSEYPPISAPTHQEVKQKFPDGPGYDLNPPVHSMTDAKGLEQCTKPFKIEKLQPQQELEFRSPDSLVEKAQHTGQKETLFANLKDLSAVENSVKGNKEATTHHLNIPKHHLESRAPDEELCVHSTSINNVSELEFKALQIMENGFRKEEGVHISLDGDSVVICGSPKLTLCVKKNLTRKLQALRNKQSDEVFLDGEETKIVSAVIEEVQSENTLCVYDLMTSKVVVYSDKQDDIRKFKHKLKIRTGKVKESERSRQRFAENAQLLEPCQKDYTLSPMSADLQQDFSGSNNASDVKIFYTKENIRIAVYMANILNLSVDCIVNAANDKMQHGGGVAKLIADAAGSELIWEGLAAVREKRNRKIPVGCQVTTTAGRLPYKCVIHTVGPCWADYEPHNLQKVKDCEKDLYAAIYGCFLEAEKNDVSSVALPAVSYGIYAVPQDMCVVQFAKAVLDYSRNSRQGQALKEIHFIDKQPQLVKLMQDTFRIMIQNGKVPNYNIQNYVASASHYQLEQPKDTGQKEHRKKDIPADNSQYETVNLKELSPFHYESKVHHTKQFVFQVSAKPIVCIYKGDILKVKNMDAVVCPDDAKGSGIGRNAIDLGAKAKYREQKEKCFERQKPDLGDVVITNGEENPFNMIVHVVIENNSPQKPEFMSTMKKSIDNILRKTNEWENVKTIAMPLFGVRPELLTEKSWAELFLERFVAFCCEVENLNLEEVHIITHFASKTAYSTLKKVFIDFADKVNKTELQEKEPPPRPLLYKICRTSDHKNRAELCSPPTISQNKMQLPSHWTSVEVTDVLQVPLDSNDTEAAIRNEYSMVKRDFDKTMSHAEVVSVKRIQNALLWEHYALQKKEMEIKAGGEGLVDEMHLYHGTTPDAVDLICHSNFDFRMAGERVGAKYGQGAYFASEARYSDSYTVRDDRNHKFMFVAKVLIGRTCLGKPPYKKPPYLDDDNKKKGTYNTCVNDVSNPTIFCVFDKNQYYPEYLVEYKLETHV